MANNSHRPIISLIAAMAENRVIGQAHGLPWRLPADMRRFVALTRGKPIVMGRRCHDTIGRALPGRHNIVLSRNRAHRAPGCTLAHDLESALAAAAGASEIMIIGGEQIYRLFLPRADRIYLTLVHGRIEGDTFFPHFDTAEWQEGDRQSRAADADNAYALTFLTLLRRASEPTDETARAFYPQGLHNKC
ncbi:MAG: dihydrofolate reductase [Nitrococcus mobilis]|nr:dihydrofolate reductase [Nitrococcus mobilis]